VSNDEAKLLLSVYRPGGQDANDPTFAKALEQVRHDPAMAAWFEEQRRLDEEMMTALAAFPVPSDGRLIAGLAVEPRRRRFALRPLALAASVVLMLSLGLWALLGDRTLKLPENASLAQLSLHLTEHQRSLGLMSNDLTRVRS
jgi:ferric-dicitrate binding protein FerR (iron transport regulator)